MRERRAPGTLSAEEVAGPRRRGTLRGWIRSSLTAPPRSPPGPSASSRRWSACPRPRATSTGAEEAIALCAALLPPQAAIERVPCSTPGSAPDLIAPDRRPGRAAGCCCSGHVDTVIGHASHAPLRRDGERLYGPGTVDMKGGDVLALGVARALAGAS